MEKETDKSLSAEDPVGAPENDTQEPGLNSDPDLRNSLDLPETPPPWPLPSQELVDSLQPVVAASAIAQEQNQMLNTTDAHEVPQTPTAKESPHVDETSQANPFTTENTEGLVVSSKIEESPIAEAENESKKSVDKISEALSGEKKSGEQSVLALTENKTGSELVGEASKSLDIKSAEKTLAENTAKLKDLLSSDRKSTDSKKSLGQQSNTVKEKSADLAVVENADKNLSGDDKQEEVLTCVKAVDNEDGGDKSAVDAKKDGESEGKLSEKSRTDKINSEEESEKDGNLKSAQDLIPFPKKIEGESEGKLSEKSRTDNVNSEEEYKKDGSLAISQDLPPLPQKIEKSEIVENSLVETESVREVPKDEEVSQEATHHSSTSSSKSSHHSSKKSHTNSKSSKKSTTKASSKSSSQKKSKSASGDKKVPALLEVTKKNVKSITKSVKIPAKYHTGTTYSSGSSHTQQAILRSKLKCIANEAYCAEHIVAGDVTLTYDSSAALQLKVTLNLCERFVRLFRRRKMHFLSLQFTHPTIGTQTGPNSIVFFQTNYFLNNTCSSLEREFSIGGTSALATADGFVDLRKAKVKLLFNGDPCCIVANGYLREKNTC